MDRLVFASFADSKSAHGVQQAFDGAPRRQRAASRARLHEGEFHHMLAADLAGTPAQSALERSTALRNAVWFFGFLAIGMGIDLSGLFPQLPWVATMVFGSIGVFAGALAVLMADPGPLERPLERARGDLREGRVVLTMRVPAEQREQAADEIDAHGGRHLFDA